MKISKEFLQQRQAMPLELKIIMSQQRIMNWYNHFGGQVYVSFSGGKDSTVLLHLARSIYPNIPAVFIDTGLEYPEIRDFMESIDNVTWLKPKIPFNQVLNKYGFPVVSKEVSMKINDIRHTKSDKLLNTRLNGDSKGNGKLPKKWLFLKDAPFEVSSKCCDIMKKNTVKIYEKETGRKPIVGTMAYESSLRTTTYLKNGCNAYNSTRPMSTPISFWLEKDIWDYINKFDIPYSDIYNMGYDRTGCMFCMFGIHLEKGENRFQKMKKTHPKQYDYCINKLGCGKVLDYIGVDY